MNFSSLALYGSCARGDNNKDSDIDMLAIHQGSHYEMLYLGNVNISAYPLELALAKARDGDLFMLHVVVESRIVTDKFGYLKRVFDEFEYKLDYSLEQKRAADLAWYLVLNSKSFQDYSMLNRRLAWCVRTILIAKSAENRTPVFSSLALSKFYGGGVFKELIENKTSPSYSSTSISLVRKFLIDECFSAPEFGRDALSYFLATGNSVAVSTLMGEVGGGY